MASDEKKNLLARHIEPTLFAADEENKNDREDDREVKERFI